MGTVGDDSPVFLVDDSISFRELLETEVGKPQTRFTLEELLADYSALFLELYKKQGIDAVMAFLEPYCCTHESSITSEKIAYELLHYQVHSSEDTDEESNGVATASDFIYSNKEAATTLSTTPRALHSVRYGNPSLLREGLEWGRRPGGAIAWSEQGIDVLRNTFFVKSRNQDFTKN